MREDRRPQKLLVTSEKLQFLYHKADMTLLFSVLWASLLGPILSQTELTDEDKQIILNYHNTLRGMVSPTAANMLEMVSYEKNSRFDFVFLYLWYIIYSS